MEAFARGRKGDALRHARGPLHHADTLVISHEVLCWAWPLAARDLHDTATTRELLDRIAALAASRVGA